MKRISFTKQRIRLMLFSCWMAGTIVGGEAAPTHQLTSPFEAEIGGQMASLPAGIEVEVVSDDGKMGMVRHTLPGGATTLLFIPHGILKGLEAPKNDAPASSPQTEVLPAQEAPPPAVLEIEEPDTLHLTTLDGKSIDGRILRLEKQRVVMLNGSGEAEDVLLKDLDKDSNSVVEKWQFQNKGKSPEADPRVKPGNQFSLIFPELGASLSSDPTKIQIRVPENYQPDKPVPLALYFGSWKGTDSYDALKHFVDSSEWVLVAFPYPADLPRPLHAYQEGKSGELIAFQVPMLERVQALFPNTDPMRRVVIGTSNGAHMIAIGACDGWKEFADYFSAFVMHEGGGSASKNFGSLRKKAVFLVMGQESKSLQFSQEVLSSVKRARIKPDVFVAKAEGHGMGNESRAAIKEWIAKLPAK